MQPKIFVSIAIFKLKWNHFFVLQKISINEIKILKSIYDWREILKYKQKKYSIYWLYFLYFHIFFTQKSFFQLAFVIHCQSKNFQIFLKHFPKFQISNKGRNLPLKEKKNKHCMRPIQMHCKCMRLMHNISSWKYLILWPLF